MSQQELRRKWLSPSHKVPRFLPETFCAYSGFTWLNKFARSWSRYDNSVSHGTASSQHYAKPCPFRLKVVLFSFMQTQMWFSTHLSSEKMSKTKQGLTHISQVQVWHLVQDEPCPIPIKQHREDPEHSQCSLLHPQVSSQLHKTYLGSKAALHKILSCV